MKIHPIETGTVQIKTRHQRARFDARPMRVLDAMMDRQWTPRLPIAAWLIEHPEGLIVVDTGESSRANDPGYLPRWHPYMRFCERRSVGPEEEIGPRMRALGFDPGDVRWVVMTHMHGDHAGGIGYFPRSEFLLTEREAADCMAWMGPANGYLNKHYPAWLSPRLVRFTDGPWESFDASERLTKDGRVRIVPTPGHTIGHQSVILDLDDHCVLIAGDASYSEAAMLQGVVDGIAWDRKLHRDSTRRIRELCRRRRTITQFAHDPDSAARLTALRFTASAPT